MTATADKISEEQAVNLVRNALLVAGTEMGADGDHWPVINDTIHKVMKDWEDLKVERNVTAELKIHLYSLLDNMERGVADCSDDIKADVVPKLKQAREICDAYFSEAVLTVSEDEFPTHIKRAATIIDTLGEEDVG